MEPKRFVELEEALLLVKAIKDRNADLSSELYYTRKKIKELRTALKACKCSISTLLSLDDKGHK